MAKTDKLAKDLQEDKEYLKHCLHCQERTTFVLGSRNLIPEPWWESDNAVLTVARILERWGQFKERTDVIDYFEKPYKFEQGMKFIVEEM